MQILVTGGAGFIGSNFIYYLLKNYPFSKVVCLDALTYAGVLKTLDLAMQNKNFVFIKGDITDKTLINEVFSQYNFSIVINFAAESHVDKSLADPEIFIKTNVLGTHVLLEACRNFACRFHQVSTDEVYGDLPLDKKELKFTESNNLNPSSPYSASKAAADLLVLAYFRTYNLPVTITRCSNNYGANQFPEKLIPLTIINAMQDLPLPIYGTGQNVRDWLHVHDHCVAIDLVMHHGTLGQVYNIGGDCEKTNIDIVCQILQQLGKPTSLITFVADRKGHDKRYAIDHSKLTNGLGFLPTINFEDGIRRTVNWYVQNKQWWKEIST